MKNRILLGLAALAMVAFLSSCGKEPVEQEKAVTAAIDSAKVLQADVYVPAEFAAVQDSMKAITAAVEVQKSKLFKKFGPIKVKLDESLALAKKVAADAVSKKEEVKKQVEGLLADTKKVAEDNAKLFKRAPRGKEGAQVLEQIKTELATCETACTDAQGLYDKGAYMDAFNKISAAKASEDKINEELTTAITKAGGKVVKPVVKK
ncbi:MAG TPA: hypothetical protein VMT63_02535 [Bacteroidales bacterium]|nr:hypothetical protein [Bacteroidales bacterium]